MRFVLLLVLNRCAPVFPFSWFAMLDFSYAISQLAFAATSRLRFNGTQATTCITGMLRDGSFMVGFVQDC